MGKFIEFIFPKILYGYAGIRDFFSPDSLWRASCLALAPASNGFNDLFLLQYRYDYKAYKWQRFGLYLKRTFFVLIRVFYTPTFN